MSHLQKKRKTFHFDLKLVFQLRFSSLFKSIHKSMDGEWEGEREGRDRARNKNQNASNTMESSKYNLPDSSIEEEKNGSKNFSPHCKSLYHFPVAFYSFSFLIFLKLCVCVLCAVCNEKLLRKLNFSFGFCVISVCGVCVCVYQMFQQKRKSSNDVM